MVETIGGEDLSIDYATRKSASGVDALDSISLRFKMPTVMIRRRDMGASSTLKRDVDTILQALEDIEATCSEEPPVNTTGSRGTFLFHHEGNCTMNCRTKKPCPFCRSTTSASVGKPIKSVGRASTKRKKGWSFKFPWFTKRPQRIRPTTVLSQIKKKPHAPKHKEILKVPLGETEKTTPTVVARLRGTNGSPLAATEGSTSVPSATPGAAAKITTKSPSEDMSWQFELP
ncbi:hypothetical protein AAG570_012024 [Ranatra chinensis]|uniref:Uncharacterized protein n=1 Tax=Ranatra chinensis TaxID=642074 RepID=A0ABD0YZX2_9HEMI